MLHYLFFLFCLLLCACSNENSNEPYNDLRDQLVIKLFTESANGNLPEFNKALTSLKAIKHHDIFLDELSKFQNNNQTIFDIDQNLRKNNLPQALFFASRLGDRDLKSAIDDLTLLNNYLEDYPYSSAESQRKAIAQLQKLQTTFPENIRLSVFIKNQKSSVERKFLEEHNKLINTAIAEFNANMIASARFASLVIAFATNKSFDSHDINMAFTRMKEFNPDFEKITPQEFQKLVINLPFTNLLPLRNIASLFTTNKIDQAVNALNDFIRVNPKFSSAVQMHLARLSSKLQPIVDDMETFSIENMMKIYKQRNSTPVRIVTPAPVIKELKVTPPVKAPREVKVAPPVKAPRELKKLPSIVVRPTPKKVEPPKVTATPKKPAAIQNTPKMVPVKQRSSRKPNQR